MAGRLGGCGAVPGGATRRTPELLRARDVSLPLGPYPHGPRAQLHDGRRGGPLQAGAWLRRPPSHGLGRLRPAGGERGVRARRPSRRVDLREYRDHARAAAVDGALHRLGARVRHLPSRLLRAPAGAVPRLLRGRPGRAQGGVGQLGPGRRHGARQRAGGGRARLALGRADREAQARAVVLPHHPLRRRAAGGAGGAAALAGQGAAHAAQLDRPLRGRARPLPHRGPGRGAGGLHHPPRYAVRRVLLRALAQSPAGDIARRIRFGARRLHRRVQPRRRRRARYRGRRQARLRYRRPGSAIPSTQTARCRSTSPTSC